MFKLFNSDNNFCEVSIVPWILFIAFSCLGILGWGVYRYDFDTDIFTERVSKDEAPMLTNFFQRSQPVGAQPQYQNQPQGQYQEQIPTSRLVDRLSIANSHPTLENAFKQAIAVIHPSVVNIKSFRRNGPNGQNGSYESVGSGIIVSNRGHILTNYHVIANAEEIIVTVHDRGQKTYNASVYDHHVDTDLTLLKIDTDDIFVPAVLGDSDTVETGDIVLAIGSPFGMEQTVTSGIISGLRQTITIEGVTYDNMIQTDAPINRGSSGGPLVSIDGEVIGINTAIYAPTGVFSGTAFAMPINRIKRFIASNNIVTPRNFTPVAFVTPSRNIPGWMGVEIQSVDRTTALHLGLPYIGGVLVNNVSNNSPALREGIKRGDVILEIDDVEILDIETFEKLLSYRLPSEEMKVLIFSNKKLHECFITLSQYPS